MKFFHRLFLLSFFCYSYSTSQNTLSLQTIGNLWQPVNNPAYPILNNLYFLSTTEGWIVGDLGKVLHTTDGGNHWSDIPLGVNTTLRAVFFSDKTIGYVGGDGVILRTQDGGFSWIKTTTDFDIHDIYFDPVLKNKGYAIGSKGIILSTLDYGNTSSSTTSGNQTLNRIAFNQPNKGWVTGSVFTTGSGSWDYFSASTVLPFLQGSISITENAGLGWSFNSSGYALIDIQFLNSNIGFIPENQMATYHINKITDNYGGYGLNSGHYEFTYDVNHYLFKTTNGWSTYSNTLIFSETSANTVRPVYISFPTINTGYAIGEDLDKIYKTTDMGNSWTTLTTGYDSLLIKRILFKTINDGWLIGTQIANDLGMGIILVTHDGGQTWQKQSPNQGFSPVNPLKSISFSNDGSGWMAGAGNQPVQYKSLNNGFSWYLISSTQNSGTDLLALNQNTVYISDGNIYRTIDGGQQWASITPGTYQYGLYTITPRILGIVFTNSSTIYANGYHIATFVVHGTPLSDSFPAIFRSIDSGSTWSEIKSGISGEYYSSLYFLNETTGWATLGYFGYGRDLNQIISTHDEGSTWNTIYLSETTQGLTYSDVVFTIESTGWVCNLSGQLFHTLDCGSTWMVSQLSQPLNKIRFISPQIGWVIGDLGTILQTTDGGNSWQYLDKITSENLNDITFTPDGTGYIVGDNGTLLRLDPGAVAVTSVSQKVWDILK